MNKAEFKAKGAFTASFCASVYTYTLSLKSELESCKSESTSSIHQDLSVNPSFMQVADVTPAHICSEPPVLHKQSVCGL